MSSIVSGDKGGNSSEHKNKNSSHENENEDDDSKEKAKSNEDKVKDSEDKGKKKQKEQENDHGKKNKHNKTTICHIPPGNPGNAHTISVSSRAVAAHLSHGDHLGLCRDNETGGGTDNTNGNAPKVSSVSSTTQNGAYHAGHTISITVDFNKAVTVTGTPKLQLETGATDRLATFTSGSGTNKLTLIISYNLVTARLILIMPQLAH